MRDGWDEEPDAAPPRKNPNQNSGLAPQYGGIPVELSLMLQKANEEGDDETKANVYKLRKMYFRNRRTDAEKARADLAGRKRFIEKYGVKGQIALKVTDSEKKYRAIAIADAKAKKIAEAAADAEPPPVTVSKPKRARKKGAK